jgi:hypothetical protein
LTSRDLSQEVAKVGVFADHVLGEVPHPLVLRPLLGKLPERDFGMVADRQPHG